MAERILDIEKVEVYGTVRATTASRCTSTGARSSPMPRQRSAGKSTSRSSTSSSPTRARSHQRQRGEDQEDPTDAIARGVGMWCISASSILTVARRHPWAASLKGPRTADLLRHGSWCPRSERRGLRIDPDAIISASPGRDAARRDHQGLVGKVELLILDEPPPF